jgi:hypothetical protein
VRDPRTDRWSGRRLHVRAKLIVLAGGAINTPAILLRSELDRNGRLGKRTFLHPTVLVIGMHPQRINAFSGAPQYVGCDEFSFVRRGRQKMSYLIEAAPVSPMGLGAAGSVFGAELQALADKMAHGSVSIALLHDGFDIEDEDEGGTVGLRDDGMPKLAYKWTPRLVQGLREAAKNLTLIQLEGGAERVSTLHSPAIWLDSPAQLKRLDQASYAALDMTVVSAHVMGGCAMGHDPRRSVVDSASLRHHELDNLFVVDGSVYPTSLTVNPQLSIYGLASWASEQLKLL